MLVLCIARSAVMMLTIPSFLLFANSFLSFLYHYSLSLLLPIILFYIYSVHPLILVLLSSGPSSSTARPIQPSPQFFLFSLFSSFFLRLLCNFLARVHLVLFSFSFLLFLSGKLQFPVHQHVGRKREKKNFTHWGKEIP